MKAVRGKASVARTPRRWRTPPPLTRGSAETLEGMEILRELVGEPGALLWQAYRNVMFWASAEPDERGKLFSPGAGEPRRSDLSAADLPAALAAPLGALAQLLDAPEDTAGDAVAQACSAIAG